MSADPPIARRSTRDLAVVARAERSRHAPRGLELDAVALAVVDRQRRRRRSSSARAHASARGRIEPAREQHHRAAFVITPRLCAPHPDVESRAQAQAVIDCTPPPARRARGASARRSCPSGISITRARRQPVLGDQAQRVVEVGRIADHDLERRVRLRRSRSARAARCRPSAASPRAAWATRCSRAARRGAAAAGCRWSRPRRAASARAPARAASAMPACSSGSPPVTTSSGASPSALRALPHVRSNVARSPPAAIPRVLGVAPTAAHVAALEPHEVRGRAGRRPLALERAEDLADANRGGRGEEVRAHVQGQGALNSVGAELFHRLDVAREDVDVDWCGGRSGTTGRRAPATLPRWRDSAAACRPRAGSPTSRCGGCRG